MSLWDIMDEVAVTPLFCIRLILFSLAFTMYKSFCIFGCNRYVPFVALLIWLV